MSYWYNRNDALKIEEKMKRLLISFILIAGFLAVPLIHVQAQGALEFDHVQVDIWPEYDQPTVLVIYKMTLAASATMPAQVTLRIPKVSGQPSSVAMQDVDNLLYNLTYTSTTDGDWIKVTFTAPSPNLQFEYYDPGLTKSGADRTYQYTWPGDYRVTDLVVRVQQPVNASQMSIQPIQGTTTVGDDTLTYYGNDVGAVALGTTFTVKMSYVKPDDTLSNTLGPVKVPTPVGQAAAFPGNLFSGLSLVMVIAIAGVVLIGGGVTWFFIQRRANAEEPARKRHVASAGPVTRRMPQEISENEAIFCHQCGKKAAPGDVFCRGCGARLHA
jgi:hypothetical protein